MHTIPPAQQDDTLHTDPVVVVTVRGGMVTEVTANVNVTVFVEDWDCPPDQPLVMDLLPEPLTVEQRRQIHQHFLPLNNPTKE